MSRRNRFLIVAFSCFLCLSISRQAVTQSSKLTQAQVEHLIQVHAPDDLVASQIRSRGLGFTISGKAIEALAAKGAGQHTLAALRDQIRVGKIQIRTEPETDVTVDGVRFGATDAAGLLLLPDVAQGTHAIAAQKAGYRVANVSITLSNNEYKQLAIPLEWSGGYLTVSSNPAGALISVEGAQTFGGNVTDAKCLPGNYTVTVTADGYANQTRTFQVTQGEHHSEQIHLAVDPSFVSAKLEVAKSQFEAGDNGGAVASAERVLQISPGNAFAEKIIAEGSFRSGNARSFVEYGSKAIQSGATITVSLLHVHNMPRHLLHNVTLTITNSGVAIVPVPPVKGCTIPEMLTTKQLIRPEVHADVNGAQTLQVSYISNPNSSFIKTRHDLDFVADGSAFSNPSSSGVFGGASAIQSPAGSQDLLRAVAALIGIEMR